MDWNFIVPRSFDYMNEKCPKGNNKNDWTNANPLSRGFMNNIIWGKLSSGNHSINKTCLADTMYPYIYRIYMVN